MLFPRSSRRWLANFFFTAHLRLLLVGLALWLGSARPAGAAGGGLPGEPQAQSTTPIPLSDIGAKATADYKGDAIGIQATAEGARLHMAFQKLAHAAPLSGMKSVGPTGDHRFLAYRCARLRARLTAR